MKKRAITSLFLILFLSLYIFTGAIYQSWQHLNVWYASYLFLIINSLLMLVAVFEVLQVKGLKKYPYWVMIIVFLLSLLLLWFPLIDQIKYEPFWNRYVGPSRLQWWRWWMVILVYGFFAAIIFLLPLINFKIKSYNITFKDGRFLFLTIIYLVLTFKTMNYLMLTSGFGWTSVLTLFLIVICSDTFAYLGGRFFGRNKLAPTISPAKTWEGAIIGLVTTIVIVMSYIVLLSEFTSYVPFRNFLTVKNFKYRYLMFFLLTLFLAITSQLGDLLFSLVKRRNNIKDFSNILPGHGGILDRIDGLSLVLFFVGFFILLQNFS